MSKNDLMFFGFITTWIILCAGSPDILDGLTHLMMNANCPTEYMEK